MASLVNLGVYVLHTQWPGDLRRVMDTFLGSLDWLEVPLGLGGSFSQTPRLGTEAAGTGGRGSDALK